jgi:hypothetical protein
MIDESEIRATIAELRARAERLEQMLDTEEEPRLFDPRTDATTPPVVPKPKGTAEEETYATLVLFLGLLSHEVDRGRGATESEARSLAIKAGYASNRAWSGWSPPGWVRDELGIRTLTADGAARIRACLDDINVVLPHDLDAALRQRAGTGHPAHWTT